MSDDIVEAWHWTDKGKLRGGLDLPAKGEWLEHFGEVRICESGLHASKDILHSLYYAPGLWLHKVECLEVVEEQYDKFVCRKRKIVKSADMTNAIVKWAEECAQLAKWVAAGAVAAYAAAANAAAHAAANAAAAADAAYAAYAYAAANAAANAAADAAAYAAYAADAADAAYAARQIVRETMKARLIELFNENAT